MKAITVWQPYASLIMSGAKRIETRGWHTNVRGMVAIHAAAKVDTSMEMLELLVLPPLQKALHPFFPLLEDPHGIIPYLKDVAKKRLPHGAILGAVDIAECLEIVDFNASARKAYLRAGDKLITIGEPEVSFGDFRPGRWAWILKNPLVLNKPVPAHGSQGFWNWNTPEEVFLQA